MRKLLVLTVLLVACGILGPDASVRFVNRRPMEPVPEVYSLWWRATEDCLGMTGEFAAVIWNVADAIWIDGVPKGGLTIVNSRDITMRSDIIYAEPMVRHEMAHVITKRADDLHDAEGHVPCEMDSTSR